MVHIKKLEVYGFKSFGFRKTVVHVEKGLEGEVVLVEVGVMRERLSQPPHADNSDVPGPGQAQDAAQFGNMRKDEQVVGGWAARAADAFEAEADRLSSLDPPPPNAPTGGPPPPNPPPMR